MKKIGRMAVMVGLIGLVTATTIPAVGQQADTNAPVIGGASSTLWDFVSTGSNYWAAPYVTAATSGGSFGGGVAVGYKVSELVNPVLRLDYFNGSVYMPSLTAQLQAPRTILGKIPITPFGIAGMGTPIAGAGRDNGNMVTILGAGIALRGDSFAKTGLISHMDLVADYEKWLGLPQKLQNQIRFGVLIKF